MKEVGFLNVYSKHDPYPFSRLCVNPTRLKEPQPLVKTAQGGGRGATGGVHGTSRRGNMSIMATLTTSFQSCQQAMLANRIVAEARVAGAP